MNKDQILEKLQAKNKNLRLPSGMGFSIENKVLTITMEEKGLTANMQTDASAFEGWAICLKAWLPDDISKVKIEGERPSVKEKSKEERHYNRFLYRLNKFINIYSSWASTTDNFKQEIEKIYDEKTHSYITDLYINVPRQDASEGATHCEAQLERAFCNNNGASYCALDHQLPVRIFSNKETKETDAITPGGFIDIWGIKDDCLKIFELKLPVNKEIGIVSELMFYVNVMTDVFQHKNRIAIPRNSQYRSFDKLKDLYDKKTCKKIEGVFLADNFHPMIESKKEEVLQIINDGKFVRDTPKLNVIFSFDKPNVNDYCPTYLEIDESKKNMTYKECQKSRQLELLKNTDGIFEDAKGCGEFDNNMYPYVLQEKDSQKNLFKGIRGSVEKYFDDNAIAWWNTKKGQNMPTGHLLSSQIHCLNHLFKLRTDPEAVLSIIKKQCPNIEKVLPSPIDQHEYVFMENEKKRIDSYITFEFTYNNVDLLKERTCKRGKDCTSIDALVYAEDREGKQVLIAIEWKYTETYAKTIGKEKYKKVVHVVKKRYLDKIATNNSHLTGWSKSYYLDPFYELARQSLLMEQIISNKPFPADYYRHIVVCPTDNKEMRADASAFKESLSACGKKFFHIIDPQEFLSPISSLKDEKGEKRYADLLDYLQTRYWK